MEFTGGLPETRCGLGSTLKFTEQLRPQLEQLLRFLKVTRMVDAPCGDFNWMSRVDLSEISYIGIDVDPRHVKTTLERPSIPKHYAPLSKITINLDLTISSTPMVDLILCRDFFQHLPIDMIHQVLHSFRRSGSRWLLATNHEGGDNAGIAAPGDFHRVDLTRAPFNLPQPVDRILDGERRTLALWEIRS